MRPRIFYVNNRSRIMVAESRGLAKKTNGWRLVWMILNGLAIQTCSGHGLDFDVWFGCFYFLPSLTLFLTVTKDVTVFKFAEKNGFWLQPSCMVWIGLLKK